MRSKQLFLIIILTSIISLLLVSSCTKLSEEDLKSYCCKECIKAFSKSQVGAGPEGVYCGTFSTAEPLSEKCENYFSNNMAAVIDCAQ